MYCDTFHWFDIMRPKGVSMHIQSETRTSRDATLRPSLWRTCRALRNRHRLSLLKDVFAFEGEFGVATFGERAGLSESTASEYLRQMNARGLIGVRREGRFVYYNTARDRSLPRAISLQTAFIAFFKTRPEGDWQTPLLRLLKGYTHPNRLRAVRLLSGRRSATVRELASLMGVGLRNAYHHVQTLLDAGLVEPVPEANAIRLCKPANPIHRVLHNLTLADSD